MVDVDPQKTLTVHFPVEFQPGVAVSLGAYDSSGEQLAFWFPPSRVLTAVTTTTEAKDWVVDTTIDFPSGNPEHDYPAPTASSPVPITPAPVRVQFAYQNANGVWYLPEFPWQTMMTSKLLDADLGPLGDDVYPPVVATTPAGEPDVYTLPGLRIESGPGIVVGSYYSLYFVQSFVKPPPVAVDRLPSAFGIYPPFRLQ